MRVGRHLVRALSLGAVAAGFVTVTGMATYLAWVVEQREPVLALGNHFHPPSREVVTPAMPSGSPLVQVALNPQIIPRHEARSQAQTGTAQPASPSPLAISNTYTVAEGDTLIDILVSAGSTISEANDAAAALHRRINADDLRPGQEITVVFETINDDWGSRFLSGVDLLLPSGIHVIVQRNEGIGRFAGRRSEEPLTPVAGVDAAQRATLALREGDTLAELLIRAGADRGDAFAALEAMSEHVNLRRVIPGQEITVVFEPPMGAGETPRLAALSLDIGEGDYVVVGRSGDSDFRAKQARAPLVPVFMVPETRLAEADTGQDSTPESEPASVAADSPEDDDAPAELALETPADAAVPVDANGVAAREPVPAEVAVASPQPEQAEDAAEPEETASAEAPAAATADTDDAVVTATEIPEDASVRTLNVRQGDTLTSLLLRAGATRSDAQAAVAAVRETFNPRRLRAGQEVTMVFGVHTDDPAGARLLAVSIALRDGRYAIAERDGAGTFFSQNADEPMVALDDELPPPEEKPVAAAEPENPLYQRLRVERGDTLMAALLRAGSGRSEANDVVAAMSEIYNLRRLQVGQYITVEFEPGVDSVRGDLKFVSLRTGPGQSIDVNRLESGGFAAWEVEIPLERRLFHASGQINSSFIRATRNAGVPRDVTGQLMNIFAFEIDFEREIQHGDRFEVFYERFYDDLGTPVGSGEVLFAALAVRSGVHSAYLHTTVTGGRDYYDESGQSLQRALLRTPVLGGRMSSGFGKRKHPVLGYTKFHRGVDFTAPRGTPVLAAGDGVIVRLGRNGGYGKYIQIRHNGTSYSTAYAHLQSYAKGLKRGDRVEQGQVIGYVGTTGLSTGPHLHYEVLVNGRQVNPAKLDLPQGDALEGTELAVFQRTILQVREQIAALNEVHVVAENQDGQGVTACAGPPGGRAIGVAANTTRC